MTPERPPKGPYQANQENDPDLDDAAVAEETVPRPKRPPQFAVLLHNDDYTTMEFVVEVLRRYFHKNEDQAVQIMLNVHRVGKCVAGIYELQIAETKVDQVEQHAQSKGFPLKCSLEPSS